MHWLTKNRQLSACVGLFVAYALPSMLLQRGSLLTAFADIYQLILTLLALPAVVALVFQTRKQTRLFWCLIAVGSFMSVINLGLWVMLEVVLKRELPEPFIGDVVLFLHLVPFMAAAAVRPHRLEEDQQRYSTTLNLLMLVVWWVFLYAFIIFPDEYVVVHSPLYVRNYNALYFVENLLVLGAFGALTATASGAWKKIYWNLLAASALYATGSVAMNSAIARDNYYSGSLYDIPFAGSVCWMIYTFLSALRFRPEHEKASSQRQRWMALTPRLAMCAILSLPVLGYWAWFVDGSPVASRQFRLMSVLLSTLVLAAFIFLRQYLLDRELVRLVEKSHEGLEKSQRLHSQLVQKEKLASLGQLVAGAAHEIKNPLAAILAYSDVLTSQHDLAPNQANMAERIKQQARRTQELVSGLLSFAQQTPGEKALVDMGSVVSRAVKMETLRLESKRIQVEKNLAPDLPPVWGNSNQLIQCCLEIIGNATDALEEVGGRTFTVVARREWEEVVIEFLDSGPGIREPHRVFDPFYTTKIVGKGTGLGLSATYGVVQDHHGQISCHNRSEGGAAFVMRLPIAKQAARNNQAPAAKAYSTQSGNTFI
jgi:signal transduction histidine kinase